MPKKIETTFEGLFDVQDIKVRKFQNGEMIYINLEMPEDKEIEGKLIYFRDERVKALITPEDPANKKNAVTMDDIFEVDALSVRALKEGDKLRLTLKQVYQKQKEIKAVKLRYDRIKLWMELTSEELPGMEEELKKETEEEKNPDLENMNP